MFSEDGYLVGPDSADFNKMPSWEVEIYGVNLYWMPNEPYLTDKPSNDLSRKVIDQISKFIYQKSVYGTKKVFPVSGPYRISVSATIGSPYAVRDAIESIYGGADDENIIFSKDAPTFQDDLPADELLAYRDGEAIT